MTAPRTGWVLFVAAALGCGGGPPPDPSVPPATLPLPVSALAGREILVLPVGLIAADDSLGWRDWFRDRAAARSAADSLIADALSERAPEVPWVLPPRLRQIAARNPTVVPDPDRMPGAVLRDERLTEVPDPLRAQLRTLSSFTSARYVLVPAAVYYETTPSHEGRAHLVIVVADVRLGTITFRSTASGDGPDPWTALEAALAALTPIER